jgi:hypothetical protein
MADHYQCSVRGRSVYFFWIRLLIPIPSLSTVVTCLICQWRLSLILWWRTSFVCRPCYSRDGIVLPFS